MAKKEQRQRAGPRGIPAHWSAPEATTAQAAGDQPVAWPLGPCWATRIDHVGSQAVYLSRQRPAGSLTMVGAVINEERGLVDADGDHAIGRSRLEQKAALLSGPAVRRAYPAPPEYVRFRIRQGEEVSQRRGVPLPPDFLTWRRLLEGVDNTWEPDFAGLEDERRQPALLEKTGVLMCAVEFMDW